MIQSTVQSYTVGLIGAMLIACRGAETGDTGDTGKAGHTDETGDSSPAATQRCPDDRSWINIAAGDRLTCGVHGDGCIECWGGVEVSYDTNDVVDSGDWFDYDDDVPPEGAFTSAVLSLGTLESGSWHACALDDAGIATCWGKNEDGQASPPTTNFSSLALAGAYSCGLGTDGTISCWGRNVDRLEIPDPTTSTERFVKIAAGYDTVCAIDDQADLQCWFYGGPAPQRTGPWSSLSTFFYTCAVAEDRPISCATTTDATEFLFDDMPTGSGYVDVCMGYLDNGCALSSTGQVECWGDYYVDYYLDSYLAATEDTYTSLSCGLIHACGVTTDGSARCWGSNGEGQTDVPP